MILDGLVHYLEITRLNQSDPTGYNILRLLEIAEPSTTGMVSHHGEVPASQVVLKELSGRYNTQQLFIHGAIPPLACVECFGHICNHQFDDTATLFLLLLQYSTHPCIAGIHRQDEVSISSWICQNRWLY